MRVTAFVLCHKLEKYVPRAMASLLTQTRSADKIVLVSTGGGIDIYELFEKYKDEAEELESSRPLSCPASKKFIGHSWFLPSTPANDTEEAFFILDADDWLMPAFIQQTAGYMEATKIDVVGCDYLVVHANGKCEPSSVNLRSEADIRAINPLPAVSLVNLAAYREVGGYRDDIILEDWALWIAMVQAGKKIKRFPQILFNHFRHEENLMNRLDLKLAREQIECLWSFTTKSPSRPRS